MSDLNPILSVLQELATSAAKNAAESAAIQLFKQVAWPKNSRPVKSWAEIVAEVIPDVEVYGPYQNHPVINVRGRHSQPDEAKKWIAKKTYDVNDPHALLIAQPELMANRLEFDVVSCLYEDIDWMRKSKKELPYVLSGNGLVVRPAHRELMLHRRANNVATYKEKLHTLGGGYAPPNVGRIADRTLYNTILREIEEEVNIRLHEEPYRPEYLLFETRTGFVQYLVIGLTKGDCDIKNLEAEGKAVPLPFDRLEDRLLDTMAWVPTGYAAVLIWLALQCPGAEGARFNGKKPGDLFNSAIAEVRRRRLCGEAVFEQDAVSKE